MPDNIKNNKRTDDFNKVKKNFKNLLFRMKSTKTWIFIFFVGLLATVADKCCSHVRRILFICFI